MRLQASELEKYLGNNDDKLNEICSEKTIQKLNRYKRGDVKESASLIDYLLTQHHENGLSLRQLAKNVGVTATTIIRIFHTYELPTLTHAEAVRANWQDHEFRERHAEAVRANWQDHEFRERHAEAVRANWQDHEFRERHAEAVRAM